MLTRFPIRTRLTVIFAALMGLVMVISGWLLIVSLRHYLDEVIDTEVTALAAEYGDDLNTGETDVLHDFSNTEEHGLFAAVFSSDGEVIEETPGFQGSALTSLLAQPPEEMDVVDVRLDDPAIGYARIGWAVTEHGALVAVGQTLGERDGILSAFRSLLVLVGAPVLGVAAWLVWLMNGAALAPVERLRAEASRIAHGAANRRLTVAATQDEIARLAETLNEMLGHLEAGIARERRLVDDASHELRTPLSILRTELDLALRRSRTEDELIAAIRSAAAISDELNSLAEDILVVARANGGQLPLAPAPTDIGALIAEIVGEFADRAVSMSMDLRTDPPESLLLANVDRTRMRQALRNLLENAFAFTREGGRITISARPDTGRARIEVTDTGPGFHTDILDRALEPYARSETGRPRRKGGAGLGLTIVRSIMLAHGGEVSIRNLPSGGACVSLLFPVDQ